MELLEWLRRACGFAVEFAGDAEERVAHGFGVETLAVGSPEEAVGGIDRDGLAFLVGAKLVSAREHDFAVEFFDGPVTRDELRREVIEEFRMAGTITHEAEVRDGFDDAFTEVVLPDAVDEDAGREGIGGAGDGFSEFETTAAFGEGFGCGVAQDRHEGAGRFFAEALGHAADLDAFVDGGGIVFDGVGERVLRRERSLQVL